MAGVSVHPVTSSFLFFLFFFYFILIILSFLIFLFVFQIIISVEYFCLSNDNKTFSYDENLKCKLDDRLCKQFT